MKCERCHGPMIISTSKAVHHQNEEGPTLKIICIPCFQTLREEQYFPKNEEEIRFTPKIDKILFVCSFGQIRSVTSVKLFGGQFLEKGLSGASPKTIRRLSKWADKIYIYEKAHEWIYERYFPEFLSKLTNLHVDDIYPRAHDPTLITLLKEKYKVNHEPLVVD